MILINLLNVWITFVLSMKPQSFLFNRMILLTSCLFNRQMLVTKHEIIGKILKEKDFRRERERGLIECLEVKTMFPETQIERLYLSIQLIARCPRSNRDTSKPSYRFQDNSLQCRTWRRHKTRCRTAPFFAFPQCFGTIGLLSLNHLDKRRLYLKRSND